MDSSAELKNVENKISLYRASNVGVSALPLSYHSNVVESFVEGLMNKRGEVKAKIRKSKR